MKRLVRANGTELKTARVRSVNRTIRPAQLRAREFVEPLLLTDGNEAELLTKLQEGDRVRPGAIARDPDPIFALLRALRGIGVTIMLTRPRKPMSLAEWDPKAKAIRISPAMARGGTWEFEKALVHEATHVAQSCRAGSLSSQPAALGIEIRNSRKAQAYASHYVYRNLSAGEIRVELEAYDYQENMEIVLQLLLSHCCR